MSRVETYEDARFGVFVHWGPAAGLGDKWNWRDEQSEQVKQFARRVETFDRMAEGFDADQWVRTFVENGAKYFTFVTHHCANLYYHLFHSSQDGFQSERDYLSEIAQACRRHGLKLILYHPLDCRGFIAWEEQGCPEPEAYRAQVVPYMRDLLAELVERYQPFGIWLDGWPGHRKRMRNAGLDASQFFDLEELVAAARAKDPELLVVNKEITGPYIDALASESFFSDHFGRIIHGESGAREVGETLPGSVKWFSRFDGPEHFLSSQELARQKRVFLKRFVSVIGRGINYLMNLGPLMDGSFQPVDLAILQHVGRFINRFSCAIYGTRIVPGGEEPWGYTVGRGNERYLFVLDNREVTEAVTCHRGRAVMNMLSYGDADAQSAEEVTWEKTGLPKDGKVRLTCSETVATAELLNNGSTLEYAQKDSQLQLELPAIAKKWDVTIIKLTLEEGVGT